MSIQPLPDQHARDLALDISQSYIVQAPAGSGKTELLTLRYLKLLAVSEQPEQVLAITFTRKAASEMRDRIVLALKWAQRHLQEDHTPEKEFERQRLTIAAAVLEKDKASDWRLLQNPGRLRVQTIDSFCSYLAHQLPVLSRIGGNPAVSEDIEPCFADAIASTLAKLEQDVELSEDISLLLQYLDNDLDRVEKLLIGLLYRRDQWLSYVLGITENYDGARSYLQNSLEELIVESLHEAHFGLSDIESELIALTNFSVGNLINAGKLEFDKFVPMTALPTAEFDALPYWFRILDILLTKDGKWRRAVNVNSGFPAGDKGNKEHLALCKQRKQQLADLREQLLDDDDLLETLNYLRLLPDPAFEDRQWQFLSALTAVLTDLGAELMISFRKLRMIDYTQTGAAARMALGSEEEPTDIALALDHKINHILVDEFQDTSQLQLELLQQLTIGWQQGDQRSLFLVGDSMQSCYGFRNANVGIYLNVQANGLGHIPLQALRLETNFRSQANVVSWVNSIFTTAFPRHANVSRGAVPYSASEPLNKPLAGVGVNVTLITHEPEQKNDARTLEASVITENIEELRKNDPDSSIAILVRSRSHLGPIISCLREADIGWQATDIDRLEAMTVIEDLLSLTRALLKQGDRLAWLSLLRAPWCGLGTHELLKMSQQAGENSIWSALTDRRILESFEVDTQERLKGFIEVMKFGSQMRFRKPLRQLVEACWTLLAGNDCCQSEGEQASVNQYFSLLSQHEQAGGLLNMKDFEEKVLRAFVPAPVPDAGKASLHLMTMHKAKGLEFDHVILPALTQAPGSDDRPLLQWHERLNAKGESRLFLAALNETGSEEDKLYSLLRHENQHKSRLEDTRLLYIAVTRAKKSASLFATLPRTDKGLSAPQSNSLLSRIWREIERLPEQPREIELGPLPGSEFDVDSPGNRTTSITRFDKPLQPSPRISRLLEKQLAAIAEPDSESEPLSPRETDHPLQRLAGTLLHQSLESYTRSESQDKFMARLDNLKNWWTLRLRQVSNVDAEIQSMTEFMGESLVKSVTSEEWGWIFDPKLKDESSELNLSRKLSHGSQAFSIDRSFIDDKGYRWIIDYKTASPVSGQSVEEFIRQQRQLHQEQLARYSKLFAELESNPVRTALFLTSIPTLVEIADFS